MLSVLDLVKQQHAVFGIDYAGPPRSLEMAERRFRVCCMMEEVAEYLVAETLEDQYDSLLDLLVFALGTMERQGLPIDGIEDVIFANMKKRIGPNVKRGAFELDLVKPDGWTPPDLSRHL